jgi:predicted nucleotidyltransferase
MVERIKKLVNKAIEKVKKEFKPIAIIHFGSSLDPEKMMLESDIDLLAVLKRKRKDRIEVYSTDEIEIAVHLFSKRDFLKSLKEGFPLVLRALKFGKFVYDPKKILSKYKDLAIPTENTLKVWYSNGWNVYSRAVFDYFHRSCLGCYLKDCHHSARSFLWALILKEKGILCEDDEEIISNSPSKLRSSYRKIVEYRKNWKDFSFDILWKPKESKILKDFEARPLLELEKILHYTVKEIEGKELSKLKDVLQEIRNIESVYVGKFEILIHTSDGKHIEKSYLKT